MTLAAKQKDGCTLNDDFEIICDEIPAFIADQKSNVTHKMIKNHFGKNTDLDKLSLCLALLTIEGKLIFNTDHSFSIGEIHLKDEIGG